MRITRLTFTATVFLAAAGATAQTATALHGTPIGTPGSYHNNGQTIADAFDGDLTTAFNGPSPDGCWAGLDLGAPATITRIGYAPWADERSRMVGGQFQVSNTPDFSSGVVTLYTVNARPPAGVMTFVPISQAGTFRYVRYLGKPGSYGNIAEMAWYGVATAIIALPATTAPATSPTPTAPPAMVAAPAATVVPSGAPAAPPSPASITVLEPTVPAGTAVHVNAWALYPSPTTLFDHILSWDFGQGVPVANPCDYAHGSTLDIGHAFPGPQAAHVYAAAGQYTITLSDHLRNPDGTAGALVQTLTTTVTITPAGRTVFYVDPRTGSDTNTGLDPAHALASFPAAQKKLASNTEIDLAGYLDPATGQPVQYPFTAGIFLPYHDVVIAGVGVVQPVLHAVRKPSDQNIWNFDKNRSRDITLSNLGFDSDDYTGTDTGSGQHKAYDVGFAQTGNFRATNIALINDTLMHLDRGPEVTGDVHGWLMQGCRQRPACEVYSQDIYDGGYDCVYAGNVFTDSVHESPVRFDNCGGPGCTNLSFVANRVGRFGAQKASFTDRYGTNHYIAGNLFVGAECSINSPGAPNTIRNVDLRQNVAVDTTDNDGYVLIRSGVFDCCVQDNRSWQRVVCYTISPHELPPALYTTNLLWRNNWGCAWVSPNPNSHARLIQLNATPTNFQPDACDQFAGPAVGATSPAPSVAPPATQPVH